MAGPIFRGLLTGSGGGGGGGGGGCGVVLNTIYDDNFDCGSSPDTAGTRFTGANPWSNYHVGTATQSGGLLTLSMSSYLGGGNPRGIIQSVLPGSGTDFRIRTKFTPTTINASFPLIGILLRESATDKHLIGGMSGAFMETRRLSAWGSWGATYSGGGTSGGGVGVPAWVEVERISGNIVCRLTFDATDGNDLTTAIGTGWNSGSHAQTADFTTAPDQWGIFTVDDTADFDWVKRLL